MPTRDRTGDPIDPDDQANDDPKAAIRQLLCHPDCTHAPNDHPTPDGH